MVADMLYRPFSLTALPSVRSFANRHNFSGGPGALPESVLEQVQEAIAEAPGAGVSILGVSHRSAWFRQVVEETEENFRTLLSLPKGYHVLFLQGGGSLQFSMVPMNLLRGRGGSADYLETGYWSRKATLEARKEGAIRVAWEGDHEDFTRLPTNEEIALDPHAAYLHYVSNETVEGLQFHRVLGSEETLRVCDMSSDLLSRPIDVERFGLIYAHAQKNLGPSGVTVVLVRDDLLRDIPEGLPAMLDYRSFVDSHSIYNTPPVFAIYVMLLVTRWLRQDIGGLDAMAEINYAKAETLYRVLDGSAGFYQGHADRDDRSWMNVAFRLADRTLEPRLLAEASDAGFSGLEGHRSLGGLRASLYNAVTPQAVDALCSFLEDFRLRHRDFAGERE